MSGGSARAAAGALALRGWALAVLAGRAGAPPGVTADAWSLFLACERCALPLSAALSRSGVSVEGAGAEALRAQATRETQRVLLARGQLRKIGALLEARGWTAALLKGGAAVAGPEPVDLADLDLLVPSAISEAVAAALDQAGHRALDRPVVPGDPAHWHLARRA